jgi:hypothetical protein
MRRKRSKIVLSEENKWKEEKKKRKVEKKESRCKKK